jgi:hypothetical protein
MSANSLQRQGGPVHDEWGIFDPRHAGVPAVMEMLREGGSPEPAVTTRAEASREAAMPTDQPQSTPTSPSSGRSPSSGGALYTLESPVRCPECNQEIRTFRVLRVLRTQVSFTSTLPRKGYVIVCPDCQRMLSAELSGLI